MTKKFCWIYTTTSTMREAQKISDHLLKKKLIACANIFPGMESRYRWKSKNYATKEIAVIFKTRALHFKKIEEEIQKMHSYDCPCIIQILWSQWTPFFSQWILDETK